MVESYHRICHPSVRGHADFVTNTQNGATPLAEPLQGATFGSWTGSFVCYRRGRPPVRAKEHDRVLGNWAAILLFVLFAGAIATSLLLASIFAGRRGKRVGRAKTMPFESGVAVAAYQPQRFSISYYLTAMMFIVFDIEMVFLAPLAVLMKRLELFGFMELVLFVVLLGVGYVYIWRKGALEWK
jgi:NADH-quinone oxidoreductase subunit A